MKNVRSMVSLLAGLAWMVVSHSALAAEPTIEARNAGSSPSGLRNGGFEEGTTTWALKAATDFAEIAVRDDLKAPEGTKVLHFSHRRTRSSQIEQRTSLEPFTYYLFSMHVRVGPYVRSGWGSGFDSGRTALNRGPAIPSRISAKTGRPSVSEWPPGRLAS
jgi:hypothetical protein